MIQTRCPGCATTFRVTPEQLKARHGKVRCGKCQRVFDAIEALLDAPSIAAAQAATKAASKATAAAPQEEAWPKTEPMTFDGSLANAATEAPSTITAAELPANEENFASIDETLSDTLDDTLDEINNDTFLDTSAEATSITTDDTSQPPVANESTTIDTAAPTKKAPLAESTPRTQKTAPLQHYDFEEEPRRRAWPWVLASLLALLVLALQALIQFRTEAAVLAPELKPALQTLCGLLDCDLPLPRKADQLSIETSDLHPDPQHKGLLILAATLKNRAPFLQTYPHLELTLTDTLDQPLLRKIIAPAEYLPKGSDIAAGFAAGRDITVNLALIPESAGKAAPAGYRLYLFYP